MNENVVLSGAEQDLYFSYADLENWSEGLGDLMNADFLHALDLLALNPQMGSFHQNPIRRWLLLDWSLGIFYTVENGINMILAVQHLKQNPNKLRKLLRSRLPQ